MSDTQNYIVVREKEPIEIIPAVVFPTKEFTKNSKYKLVRAMGQIGIVVPMLPYTIVILVLFMVLGACLIALGNVSSTVSEWWSEV